MTNYQVGHDAEKTAADYLKSIGFTIREINWKTRYCEIDIVAEKGATIYFVEVKSRKNQVQGSGLEYITAKKLKQMAFAAEMWVSQHEWRGDYMLSAISIDNGNLQFVKELV